MNQLAILLPTYKRPGSLQAVATNLEKATKHSFSLYFGIEKDDPESLKAAIATGYRAIVNKYEPGYSNTIQSIYEASKEPFLIHANDDFLFLPHWDEGPMGMFDDKNLMVVGLRQTEGDVHGSAISLFRRQYIQKMSGVADMPNRVFYPYNHNYVDTEFTRTAQRRNVWAKYGELVIVHQHPGFTGREKDYTYRKNEETVEKDHATFESRQHLWS